LSFRYRVCGTGRCGNADVTLNKEPAQET